MWIWPLYAFRSAALCSVVTSESSFRFRMAMSLFALTNERVRATPGSRWNLHLPSRALQYESRQECWWYSICSSWSPESTSDGVMLLEIHASYRSPTWCAFCVSVRSGSLLMASIAARSLVL